jgi:uracil-DNA glycosylase
MTKKDQIKLLKQKYEQIRTNDKLGNYDNLQDNTPIIYGGNVDARIMVIARDLGRDEVIQRQPLIGRAGQLFRSVAKYYDLLNDMYLTNLIPYKPVKNIVFEEEIRGNYLDLLREQIKIIRPKIIMTLGKESLETIREENISSVLRRIKYIYSNRLFEINNVLGTEINVKCLPLAHPSFLIRKGLTPQNVIKNNSEYSRLYLKIPMRIAKLLREE